MSNPSRTRHISITAVVGCLAVITGLLLTPSSVGAIPGGWSDIDEHGTDIRPIVFPVDPGDGEVSYVDDWLDPRGSERRHLGSDIMGDKLMPLLAARSGCLTRVDFGGPGAGNYLTVTDADGWQYRYIHVNNDSPGTDDGTNPREWAFVDGLDEGDCVAAGDHIAYLGDSGNAEWSTAHLHFEIQRPDGTWINPYHSLVAAELGEGLESLPPLVKPPRGRLCDDPSAPDAEPERASASGYWLLETTGAVHAYGDAEQLGDLVSEDVDATAVSMEATPSGLGYWIVDADGVVHAFGDAPELGDMSEVELDGPVRRIEAHPDGAGYWLVADDGGVFTFGTASFHGSMGDRTLEAPVISMTATTDGAGYWLVGADGGVFTFGTALFHGSTGGIDLSSPVIDMAVHPAGGGYWLYAGDGGVFTFGDTAFHGSAPGLGRCDIAASTSLRVSATGAGYWIANEDGEVLTFGDAAWYGDLPRLDPGATIADMAVRTTVPTTD